MIKSSKRKKLKYKILRFTYIKLICNLSLSVQILNLMKKNLRTVTNQLDSEVNFIRFISTQQDLNTEA